MISIVFGKPGRGKTAYLTAIAMQYLNGSSVDYKTAVECQHAVEGLNNAGFSFTVPQQAPVYSNYNITVPLGNGRYKGSYYIDGFHLGFPNEYVEVIPVYPGSKIFLSEAQRYYNSRRSKDLPEWVSRYFEEHRHYSLDIYLDVQRPGLIDVNIRDIAESFVEVQEIRQETDEHGRVARTVFKLRKFTEWKQVESYVSNDSNTYVECEEGYVGDVFKCYQSCSYFKNFLPDTGDDFNTLPHVAFEDVEKDVELSKLMYRQTAPEGFYPTTGSGKKR